MNARPPAPLSWCRACYALDTGASATRMVRAERSRGGVRIEAVDPAGPHVREELAAGIPVVSYLGVRESFVRRLEAPLPQRAKARRVLPTLLDIDLPFPIEDCLYAFADDQVSAAGKLRALAVGARRADVERKVREAAGDGFDPAVLDQEGLALWTQAAREAPATPRSPAARAAVHLGPEPALAVGQDGRLLGAYALRAADTAAHIGHILRSLFPPGTAVDWVWTGDDAGDDTRRDAVASAVQRDWPGPSACVRDPGRFRLRAIAHRALCAGPLPCNLRSGEWTHPAVLRRETRRHVLAACGVLAAGATLLAANIVWRGNLAHRERTLDLAFSALASELAGFPVAARGEHAIGQVQQAVDARRTETEPITALLDGATAATVSSLLTALPAADVRLSQVTLSPQRVLLTGDAGTWTGPEALSRLLKARGYTARLDRLDAGDDGRIPFTIEGSGAR